MQIVRKGTIWNTRAANSDHPTRSGSLIGTFCIRRLAIARFRWWWWWVQVQRRVNPWESFASKWYINLEQGFEPTPATIADNRYNHWATFAKNEFFPLGTWRLYNVALTSMQRLDVASTLIRRSTNVILYKRNVPTGIEPYCKVSLILNVR